MTSRPAAVAITMAGFGTRFLAAGYKVPKYMIDVNGATLFEWSVRGLDRFIAAGAEFVFIVRSDDRAEGFIRENAMRLGIVDPKVVCLEAPTDGQATTARLAIDHVDPRAPFAIFNIDTHVAPGLLDPSDARGAGWIPCFEAAGNNWSFVRCDRGGKATEVREKQRISDDATIGFYWFDAASRFQAAYDTYYGAGGREERGERYVAPLYNQLIRDGHAVYVTRLRAEGVVPLGTPAEVAAFAARSPGAPAPAPNVPPL